MFDICKFATRGRAHLRIATFRRISHIVRCERQNEILPWMMFELQLWSGHFMSWSNYLKIESNRHLTRLHKRMTMPSIYESRTHKSTHSPYIINSFLESKLHTCTCFSKPSNHHEINRCVSKQQKYIWFKVTAWASEKVKNQLIESDQKQYALCYGQRTMSEFRVIQWMNWK